MEMFIAQIQSGEFLPGEVIPSERSLALRYGVSRQVVRSAHRPDGEPAAIGQNTRPGDLCEKPDYNKGCLRGAQ